jgi:hypothetical protein
MFWMVFPGARLPDSMMATLLSESQACLNRDMRDLDPSQYGQADRRAVHPPIEVHIATWSAGGTLDWWEGAPALDGSWTGSRGGSKPLIFGPKEDGWPTVSPPP